jgi:sugar lactone lactonase YvrE
MKRFFAIAFFGFLGICHATSVAQNIWYSSQFTIGAFNPVTGSEVASYNIGSADFLAFDSEGMLFYAQGSSGIKKINPATGTYISGFATISSVGGMAFDSAGNLWYSASNSIVCVNPNTGDQIKAYNFSMPGDLAFDSAGMLYYAANYSGIYKINPATGAYIDSFSTRGSLKNIAFDATGNLWLSVTSGLDCISPTDGTLLHSYDIGYGSNGDLVIDSEGMLYYSPGYSGINQVNPTTGSLVNSYLTGGGLQRMAIQTPEPTTGALFLLGIVLAGLRRRR